MKITVQNFLFLLLVLTLLPMRAYGANKKNEVSTYRIKTDISYVDSKCADSYRNERCKLDMYIPEGKQGFATVVFFHGGGLEGGSKFFPELLKNQGFAIIAPNYRLSPHATHPAYIDDAAASVAWVMKHISEYGGDAKKVYVCGHSAGGYLTLMLALDKDYLGKYGIDADSIAGYVPFSGQTNTHYTIRKERGMDMQIPVIDKYAPIFNSRKMGTRMMLLTGDRDKELLARYTENQHLQEILNAKGNNIELYELKGFDHGTMLEPACLLLRNVVRKAEE